MDLERERGITIKLQPVRMEYGDYILNLVDTPGHVDFSYEVSRSLAAVEGAILLVDVTQGIQAQTLANLHLCQKQGLKIIGAVNKVDLAFSQDFLFDLKQKISDLSDRLESLIKAVKSGSKWTCDLPDGVIEDIIKIEKDAVKDTEELLLVVESYGNMSAKDIFAKAVEALEDNLDEVVKALK